MMINAANAEKVLNGLFEPVFLLNAEKEILFNNQAAIEVFGDGYVGKNFVRLIRNPEVIRLISNTDSTSQTQSIKVALDHPVSAFFEFSVTRLDPASTDEAAMMIALRDLTDLRYAEQMRSDFVANVSHELRSPLTALSGFIETLNGPAKNDSEARGRFLVLMERESSRMTRLIGDLLTLSKVETNRNHQPFEQLDVAALADRVVASLANSAKAEGKTIKLESEPDLKPIAGNEDELTQVLVNLVENSLKYSAPESQVSVVIKTANAVGGFAGDVLTIEVRDQGEGIAREHIPRLTERFYRVDTHRSRDKGGTGLGLAIVKHIVNRHRGRLQITSEQNKGSTFRVYLPFTR